MTITEKDKKLLVVAGIFLAAIFLILFVIQPGFTKFSENNAKIETLKVQKETMKTEIDALPTYEANLKAAIEAYNTAAARIYPDLTADKVQDTIMSNFIDKYSLSVSNLSIAAPTSSAIPQFVAKAGDETTVATTETTTESTDATEATNGAIKLVTVTANVSGGAENIIAMVDAMNAAEGVYVQQISYSSVAEGTTASITFFMALSETFA